MKKKGFVALVLSVLCMSLILTSCSSGVPEGMKPLKVGTTTIKYIPKDALIDVYPMPYDEKMILELLQNNLFVEFEGTYSGGIVDKSMYYEMADLAARTELSKFLDTIVQGYSAKVSGILSEVKTTQNNADVNEMVASAGKTVQEAFTVSRQQGAKVLCKYYVPTGNKYEYHVSIFYNPQAVINYLEQTELIKKAGDQQVQLQQALNDVIKEAKKGTPMDQKQ